MIQRAPDDETDRTAFGKLDKLDAERVNYMISAENLLENLPQTASMHGHPC